jgi:hypothetical protein
MARLENYDIESAFEIEIQGSVHYRYLQHQLLALTLLKIFEAIKIYLRGQSRKRR